MTTPFTAVKCAEVRETAYGEFRQRRQETLWHRLNRLLVLLVVIAALITVGCLFLPLLDDREDQTAKVEELQTKIDEQRRDLAKHEREVKLLQNDREYIELKARDSLEQMKPGEQIYRFDPPPPDTSEFKRVGP